MHLRDISNGFSLSVMRDAEFQTLGTITDDQVEKLVYVESQRWLNVMLKSPNIRSVLTRAELAQRIPQPIGLAVSDNPREAFFALHNHLAAESDFYWKDFPSAVSSEARIHKSAVIAGRNVRIGKGSIIEANVTILERTIIGENVVVRPGARIGTEGFEFFRVPGGIASVRHAGGVQVSDRVEIQANCAIDKSVFRQFTEIGEDTKLDNLVHVAHNVRIGKRNLIAAGATLAGSVTIGDAVWIGPGATISDDVAIGDRAHVALGSVVVSDVGSDESVAGNFAVPHKRLLRFVQSLRR